MIVHLLDTNTISEFVSNPSGRVARQLSIIDDAALATSVIVAGELRFGAERKGLQRLTAKIEAALAIIPVLPLNSNVDIFYGKLRANLQRRGCIIGNNDMWIAAHALSLGATRVTDNTREFARVEGLALENWLRD